MYYGALLSYDEMSAWTTNRCIPLVREITFENAEVVLIFLYFFLININIKFCHLHLYLGTILPGYTILLLVICNKKGYTGIDI